MTERGPWERLRSALSREEREPKPALRPLAGVTVESFRAWAADEGLADQELMEDGVVSVEGAHRLGAVRARCLTGDEAGTVFGVDVAVTAAHPGAPPDLAALLLRPVTAALQEPQRSALDSWLRGQLAHRGPYNAATTLPGLQVAIAIDDANARGRTWAFTARAS